MVFQIEASMVASLTTIKIDFDELLLILTDRHLMPAVHFRNLSNNNINELIQGQALFGKIVSYL